jgi:hypothetical protein
MTTNLLTGTIPPELGQLTSLVEWCVCRKLTMCWSFSLHTGVATYNLVWRTRTAWYEHTAEAQLFTPLITGLLHDPSQVLVHVSFNLSRGNISGNRVAEQHILVAWDNNGHQSNDK